MKVREGTHDKGKERKANLITMCFSQQLSFCLT